MNKNEVIKQDFNWLFIGTVICFAVSYLSTINLDVALVIFGAFGGYGAIVYAIIELVVAIILIARIHKMKPTTAKILYLLYTALTGLSLSGIFLVYTSTSLAFVFLGTALIFGIFALIGKTTKADLSKMGIYLFVCLLAIIILEIINLFILNNTLDIITCIIGIAVFAGYVAYDIKRAINMGDGGDFANAGIYCAFQLFLDFINIFIRLLRLFGNSRD